MGTLQREAALSLIYKKEDRNQIKNYRPISLTNIDYTILAFTLSQRIKKVIPSIISDDQTALCKIQVHRTKYKTNPRHNRA